MGQQTANSLGVDYERWARGLTLPAFVDTLGELQADMRRRLRDVRLAPVDSLFFTFCSEPVYVLVMTEPWCGDSLMTLPILARIVEAAPSFDLRIVVRSESPELDSAYRARNIANIPVFTFFDADFREVGTWVERPRAAHEQIARWRAEHPALAAIRDDPNLQPDEKQARLEPLTGQLRRDMERWYANGLQSATVAELTVLLSDAGCSFGCGERAAQESIGDGDGV